MVAASSTPTAGGAPRPNQQAALAQFTARLPTMTWFSAPKGSGENGQDSTDSSSTDGGDSITEFAPLVEKLRKYIEAGEPLTRTIGRLKTLEKAITALDAGTSVQGVQILSELGELAIQILPEDTRGALESSGCGSDVALEVVRRNLSQLPTLAKALYNVTSEALEADDGLRSLYVQLGSALNLYGAFVSKGINPRKRAWARTLTDKFSSLAEMRRVPWFRLERIIGIAQQNASGEADDTTSDEELVDVPPPEQQQANGTADSNKPDGEVQKKIPGAVAPAPLVKARSPVPRGEVVVIQDLYAGGTDTAPIRRQALDFGLGLHAADQLEDAGITTAAELTESNIRIFEGKLFVPEMSEEDVSAALHSMVANKKASASKPVPAAETEDSDKGLFGTYDTHEELVASAGGGMALYGINFFPNKVDVTLKPYAPLLSKPTYVEMAGASASFEASVMHSTEMSMAASYTKTAENGGISVAQSSTTSWGVSASVSGFGGIASAEASADSEGTQESTGDTSTSNAFSANSKKATTTATMVETIMCPMKSFRIPVSNMRMSEEALDSALCVNTLLKAGQFLDTFGSHVSNGRHLLGGIFFRTITMTSETEVDTSTLLSAASTQMENSRSDTTDVSTSVGGGTIGISAKASASFGKATSSGVVTFKSSSSEEGSTTADSRAMFQTYIRSMGPNVATAELFAEALFTDTSSWTVIDRGPFEALLPITEVMENMLGYFDVDSPGKAKLENAINLVTVAWQQRAAVWKPLENDPAVPVSLRNMIGRSFEAQDAHDQIRAAVVNLFEVMGMDPEADIAKAAGTIGDSVIVTAEEMKAKPAGEADFFRTLQGKVVEAQKKAGVTCGLKEGTVEWAAASRSAKKLSSTDWSGFDMIWNKRQGTLAIKDALEKYLLFEKATLKLGESVTIDSPLVSVNGKYRLEMSENKLQVVCTDNGTVKDVIFECDGMLGRSTVAHLNSSGAFVLDLTMITGFSRTETKVVLWTAPNSEGNKGSYCRMQNDGAFVVFNKKGKKLWSSASSK